MAKMPNVAFLTKVEEQRVFSSVNYSARTGMRWTFHGGEVTAEKHAAEGYVRMASGPSLGRPAYVTLTDKGRTALALARGEPATDRGSERCPAST